MAIEKRVTKSGKVRWRVRVRLAGYPPRSGGTHVTRRAAVVAEARLLEELQAGSAAMLEAARGLCLRDVIARYRREKLYQKSDKVEWCKRQDQQLREWEARLGDVRWLHVNKFVLAQARDALAAEGRSGATVNRYLSTLGHVLSVARDEWGLRADNPMQTVARLKEAGERVRFLSEDELAALMRALPGVVARYGKPLDVIVVLALSTGARKDTELLSMPPAQVMLDANKIVLEHTKNGKRRALALEGRAHELMCAHMARLPARAQFVFANHRGDKPMNIDREWNALRRAAGLVDYRFHDHRHTFASYLAMQGAREVELAEALGHSDLKMVRRYAHLAEGHTNPLVAAMNDKLFSGLKGV